MATFSKITRIGGLCCLTILATGLWPHLTQALQIPVEDIATPTGTTVGFVDMEKIFQEFPETRRAKAEYLLEVQKKRGFLLERELAVKDVHDRIDTLKESLGSAVNGNVAASTDTVRSSARSDQAEALILRQQELSDKNDELEKERLKAEQDLVDYERRRSQAILGRIYAVLQELAQEDQISVVVDKSHILYGIPQVDLTEKLRDRLRTR